MPRRTAKDSVRVARDPERTKRRILAAALHEFAARGFAGARVDAIAGRAGANKRMLYHYFGDKEGLFRAVLHQKLEERMGYVEAIGPDKDLFSSLHDFFSHNCNDPDLVRLLAWESLQTKTDSVVNEAERRQAALQLESLIRASQAAGRLRRDVSARCLQVARLALTLFPLAMPQLTRMAVGCSPRDPEFQSEYALFLKKIAAAFRPENGAEKRPRKTDL
jgi:TetR/AcrR family transcriptional regulator